MAACVRRARMTQTEETWLPTRQTLLSRLKNWEDQSSWREFFNLYWRLIYGVARQAGLSDGEAQEVVQDTIITVAKQMPQFRYDKARGSFKSWLRKTAHWRIQDQFVALERVKKQVEAKEFQVFDLCTNKGWPAAKVARALHLFRPQVYYLNKKVTRLIEQEMRTLNQS